MERVPEGWAEVEAGHEQPSTAGTPSTPATAQEFRAWYQSEGWERHETGGGCSALDLPVDLSECDAYFRVTVTDSITAPETFEEGPITLGYYADAETSEGFVRSFADFRALRQWQEEAEYVLPENGDGPEANGWTRTGWWKNEEPADLTCWEREETDPTCTCRHCREERDRAEVRAVIAEKAASGEWNRIRVTIADIDQASGAAYSRGSAWLDECFDVSERADLNDAARRLPTVGAWIMLGGGAAPLVRLTRVAK